MAERAAAVAPPPMTSDACWYAGRSTFVTGHSGFKGAWLSAWLAGAGARVTGYGLVPDDRAAEPLHGGAHRRPPHLDHRRRSRPRAARGGARDLRARGRVPPRRPATRAALVPGAGRDLRDERDGHGCMCSTPCDGCRRCARSWSSPATSATRTTSSIGPTSRPTRWADTTRTARARRARSW